VTLTRHNGTEVVKKDGRKENDDCDGSGVSGFAQEVIRDRIQASPLPLAGLFSIVRYRGLGERYFLCKAWGFRDMGLYKVFIASM